MREKMAELINRKNELELGILPFVEPGSIAEDLAYDEYFFINKQIGTITRESK